VYAQKIPKIKETSVKAGGKQSGKITLIVILFLLPNNGKTPLEDDQNDDGDIKTDLRP
jgi:hypothetical protein